MLTRTIGISLAIAAVAAPLLAASLGCAADRRGDPRLPRSVVELAGFRRGRERRRRPQPSWWRTSSATDRLAARGPLEALRVAGQNLLRLSFGLGYFQLALPLDFVHAAIEQGGARLVLLHAICHATLLLALWGFWLSARDGIRTLHLYAALYGAMILIWTFSPYRFLVPWTPFLLYFAATGLRAALGARPSGAARARRARARGRLCDRARALPRRGLAARSAAASTSYFARELTIDWTELRDVERFLREHTQPDEVIASSHPERLVPRHGTARALLLARHAIRWRSTTTRRARRAASRSSRCRRKRARAARTCERNLARVYREAKIAWYVEWTALALRADLRAGCARDIPAGSSCATRLPGRSFAIYRVRIPPD